MRCVFCAKVPPTAERAIGVGTLSPDSFCPERIFHLRKPIAIYLAVLFLFVRPYGADGCCCWWVCAARRTFLRGCVRENEIRAAIHSRAALFLAVYI